MSHFSTKTIRATVGLLLGAVALLSPLLADPAPRGPGEVLLVYNAKSHTSAVIAEGGRQTWATSTCSLSGVSGTHTVHLVFKGGSGAHLNLEWFDFN